MTLVLIQWKSDSDVYGSVQEVVFLRTAILTYCEEPRQLIFEFSSRFAGLVSICWIWLFNWEF